MVKTALELSPEERKAFRPRPAATRLSDEEKAALTRRRQKAIRLARKAARLLRDEFGAERVLLFGSLAHRGWFTSWSDIDLAAWGIPPTRFYEAVAAVTGMSEHFRLDLVDPETCCPGLKEAISREGIPL
jgi:predicted nucleotidyltransferase